MSYPKVMVICCGCEKIFVGGNLWIQFDKSDEDDLCCRHTVCPSCFEKHLKPLKFGPVSLGPTGRETTSKTAPPNSRPLPQVS